MSHAGYLKELFDQKLFDKAVGKISNKLLADIQLLKVNCIVATGLSGLIMASAVAYRTKTPLVAVRKNEKRHSSLELEYPDSLDPIRGILIDDQIATGATVKRVCDKIYPRKGKIIGIYLYHFYSSSYSTGFEYKFRNKLIDVIKVYDMTVDN